MSWLALRPSGESFFHQPLAKRAAIVAAGPIANFILAIVIFAAVFAAYGRPDNVARVEAGVDPPTRRS